MTTVFLISKPHHLIHLGGNHFRCGTHHGCYACEGQKGLQSVAHHPRASTGGGEKDLPLALSSAEFSAAVCDSFGLRKLVDLTCLRRKLGGINRTETDWISTNLLRSLLPSTSSPRCRSNHRTDLGQSAIDKNRLGAASRVGAMSGVRCELIVRTHGAMSGRRGPALKTLSTFKHQPAMPLLNFRSIHTLDNRQGRRDKQLHGKDQSGGSRLFYAKSQDSPELTFTSLDASHATPPILKDDSSDDEYEYTDDEYDDE